MRYPQLLRTWQSSILSIASVVLVLAALTAPALQAQILQQSDNPMMNAPEDHHVVFYPPQEPLADSSVLTLRGFALKNGGCEFSFPVLTLGPDEVAVQARQISTNFTDCTTVLEIGTPLDEAPKASTDAEGTTEVQEAVSSEGGVELVPQGELRRQLGAASGSSSAYYRVWWEDVINLRVHEAKSNISWSYDGSCVNSASGSLHTYWLTASGWGKNSSGSWVTSGCSSRKVYSDATFQNGAFCWPGDVFSYYDNVTVRGTANNGLSGWVGATWSTYPFACPTLHYHTELRRITG